MSYYGYDYFCGANVTVSVEGMPVLEAFGLRVNLNDSKMPVYGYSSRHYDGVAAGQVIVRGNLLVNYIHQDYLFRAIQQGLGQTTAPEPKAIALDKSALDDFQALANDYPQALAFAEALKNKYWSSQIPENFNGRSAGTLNPNDFTGGVDLTVAFGEQNSTRPYGVTGMLIRDVHFQSRGIALQVDEHTIVEQYDFFARNLFSTRNPNGFGTVKAEYDTDSSSVTITQIDPNK